MKKTLFLVCIIFFSCTKYDYKKNSIADIVLVKMEKAPLNLTDLSMSLAKFKSKETRLIVVKSIIRTLAAGDSAVLNEILSYNLTLYSSASYVEQGRKDFDEDLYFRKSNFLLEKNFTTLDLIPEPMIKLFKGIGIEAVAVRNSGQIESYYAFNSIRGKSYASLPICIATDLKHLDSLKYINPDKMYLSKQGTFTLLFSEPNEQYDLINESEIGKKDLKNKIVILFVASEKIATVVGAKEKAEITADAINQLLWEL